MTENPNIYMPSNIQEEKESLKVAVWQPQRVNRNGQEFVINSPTLLDLSKIEFSFQPEPLLIIDDDDPLFMPPTMPSSNNWEDFCDQLREEMLKALGIKKSDGIL